MAFRNLIVALKLDTGGLAADANKAVSAIRGISGRMARAAAIGAPMSTFGPGGEVTQDQYRRKINQAAKEGKLLGASEVKAARFKLGLEAGRSTGGIHDEIVQREQKEALRSRLIAMNEQGVFKGMQRFKHWLGSQGDAGQAVLGMMGRYGGPAAIAGLAYGGARSIGNFVSEVGHAVTRGIAFGGSLKGISKWDWALAGGRHSAMNAAMPGVTTGLSYASMNPIGMNLWVADKMLGISDTMEEKAKSRYERNLLTAEMRYERRRQEDILGAAPNPLLAEVRSIKADYQRGYEDIQRKVIEDSTLGGVGGEGNQAGWGWGGAASLLKNNRLTAIARLKAFEKNYYGNLTFQAGDLAEMVPGVPVGTTAFAGDAMAEMAQLLRQIETNTAPVNKLPRPGEGGNN